MNRPLRETAGWQSRCRGMKNGPLALLLAAAACTAPPPADVPPSPEPTEPPRGAGTADEPRVPLPPEPPISGFSAAHVREWVARHVAARIGAEAVTLAEAAATSIMVTHHQGLPRPVRNADGSWGYEPPGANAMVRTADGWTGWSGRERRPVSGARAAEIDRILADPAFWAEPDHVPPTCTDAGARRLVVRHAGRAAVRQQSCGGVGLTGRLWELVYGGPG